MEERPITPDSEGRERVRKYSPIVRAVGWHRSGNLWVNMETEAGWDLLVEAVDNWLPKLSEHLYYEPKTYPVIVHGFPTPLNAMSGAGSEGSDNLTSIHSRSQHVHHYKHGSLETGHVSGLWPGSTSAKDSPMWTTPAAIY